MQTLRDLVLIELEDSVIETKRESGIILLSTQNNLYQIGDEESMLKDLISKPKMNKGTILSVGSMCSYFKEKQNVVYRKDTEQSIIDVEGKRCAIVRHKDILVMSDYSGLNPDYVLVKITKAARESLFNKVVTRDDGERINLFVAAEKEMDDVSANEYFVSSGEIVAVGDNIKEVSVGDIGLLSYLCDNDQSIIVGYDGLDKIIAVQAVTTRHTSDNIVYSNQQVKRTQTVWSKGDYEEMSSLYGVVNGEKLIPIEPYVFLNHEITKVMKVGRGGVIYEEDEKIIKRKVLAVSNGTSEIYGVNNGDVTTVFDFDVFDICFNGNKISAINDVDILFTFEK